MFRAYAATEPKGQLALDRGEINVTLCCLCHSLAPTCETSPMSKINDALGHLRAGKARDRIVLEADFD